MNPANHIYPVPQCSVAMATWNGAAFLPEQLDSILSQTHTDFELVIVDDASTDDTRALIESYAAKDPRIRLYCNETNLGYRANFFRALTYCRSDLIFLSDQDDRWLQHKMEVLLNKIGENFLIFSDSILIDETGSPSGKKISDTVRMLQPGEPAVNRGFVIGNCVWGHTILFKRALLEYIRPEENVHPHDWWLAVVSSHLQKIAYCPEVLNEYRQHAQNLTHAIPRKNILRKGSKLESYSIQLTRLRSIRDLAFNTDRAFYERWYALYLERKKHFSLKLFLFLLRYREDIFRFKRKHFFSRLTEIRKMCRKV